MNDTEREFARQASLVLTKVQAAQDDMDAALRELRAMLDPLVKETTIQAIIPELFKEMRRNHML